MAISNYDINPDENKTIGDPPYSVWENCQPSVLNNAIRDLMSDLAALVVDETYTGIMNWMGAWIQQAYRTNDVVLDEGWLMIANTDTQQRAGIFPTGEPFNIYEGTIGTTNTSAKQVLFGNRFTVAGEQGGYIVGYRVNVIAGNEYIVYLVEDPLTAPIITQLSQFTADATGWVNLNIATTILTVGQTLDIICAVSEPSPTPITWTGTWNYTKPNNEGVPLTGEAQHAARATGVLKVHKTDADLGDRSAELLALSIGDIINMGGSSWSIQSVTDNTTYVSFGISPQLQDPAAGDQLFTFETVAATPITYAVDTDYWLSTSFTAQGLLGVDITYGSIVPDDSAYGIDLTVQAGAIPTDWDVLSAPSSATSLGSGAAQAASANNFNPTYVLSKFTLSTLPAPAIGGLICVTDDPSGPVLAFSDGTSWNKITVGAVIS